MTDMPDSTMSHDLEPTLEQLPRTGSLMRPARFAMPTRILVGVAGTVLLLAGCLGSAAPSSPVKVASLAPTAESSQSASMVPSPSIATPSIEPVASSPTPLPSFVATRALGWQALATKGGPASPVSGAVSFRDGYLAFGGAADDRPPWVAGSTDGLTWESTRLGVIVQPCPDYVRRPDSSADAGATDGRQVVIVGLEYAMDVEPCGSQRAVAWVSSDGRTWQRSQGFGAIDGYAEAIDVWAIPGGWEARVVTGSDRPDTLWRSADGLKWEQASGLIPAGEPYDSAAIATAVDGTQVLALSSSEGTGQPAVRTSSDGVTWNPVAVTLPAGSQATVLAPAPVGPLSWLIVTFSEGTSPIVWVSSDLQQWQHQPFPRQSIDRVALTRYGLITTGSDLCAAGGPCSAKPASQYLSTDGLHWTRFASSVGADIVVDGPAGVLGFAAGGPFRVWQLQP